MLKSAIIAVLLSCVAWAMLAANLRSVQAGLVFNVTFDSSTGSAPTGFITAFNDAIQIIEATYSDSITINIHVGWGEINGQSLTSGDIGQSSTNQTSFYSYSQIKNLLVSDEKSAADAIAVASLPASDPYGGTKFVMSDAEAKALGLLAGNAPGIDGYVGFRSTTSFTFDPSNRAVPGKYDFIGLAEHEITEVMGRYGLGQNGASSGRYSPIDLFRYSSPGVLDLVPANGAYFSINGGTTVINTFNGTGGGDLSDWKGATIDSYNAFLTEGVELPISAGDITVMDVIGYDVLLPGDFNRDGHVDAADVLAMEQALANLPGYETANNLTNSQLLALCDINGDGVVNNADLQAMLNFLQAGGGSISTVPEPSGLLLLAFGGFALVVRRRIDPKARRR